MLVKRMERALKAEKVGLKDFHEFSKQEIQRFFSHNGVAEEDFSRVGKRDGIPLYLFSGSKTDLFNMESITDEIFLLEDESDAGENLYSLVRKIVLCGWPINVPLGFIKVEKN